MYVLVCRTSSPIFTLNIYVPTAAPNNKGLPHTLEHLIFCGSKRYPIRGYIDTLASYNYSIIDYHHKYYDANNVTVVLIGAFSDDFEEKYLQTIPADIFKQLIDTQFDGDKYALEKAAKRLSDKMASNIEEAPGDAMQEIFYPDIVASHFLPESQGIKKLHIGSLLRQFDIIADVSKRPVEFWIGLLKKWLIDGTVYHFALVPDTELGPKLDLERKKIEQANAAKFVDKEAHAMRIKKAVDASTAHVSEEVKKAMRAPDPTKTTILPHKQNLVVLDNAIGPVVAVQSINVDSGFAEAQIQIPIGNITDDQRSYLTLFQELLMGTDILLPAGVLFDNSNTPLQTEKRVRYSVFESRISDLVASRYSRFGQRLQLFSCIDAVKQLFLDMHNNWDTIISDTDVNLAQSVMKYECTIEQSVPAGILNQSISNSIHGFANADEYNTWYSTHVVAVKISDMCCMFKKYMLPFTDSEYPMFHLLVMTSDVDIPAELGPFEQKTLEEISATYKANY
ncbi:hypothetical protein GGH99_000395 [Coemansia sp. RSA 1285]|nr:hypothetical protein GGH99_000395 [Coemansia sp. RSA 1285]